MLKNYTETLNMSYWNSDVGPRGSDFIAEAEEQRLNHVLCGQVEHALRIIYYDVTIPTAEHKMTKKKVNEGYHEIDNSK